mgnify:CR=1 FL=1
MILSDFKDYFTQSESHIQEEIISSLLSLSLEEPGIKDNIENKAVTCPHCQCACIRANGKLRGVQRYLCNG